METLTIPEAKPRKKIIKSITGAEAVIRSLVLENVELLFGYPGGAIMPVYDALYKFQDNLKHVLTRHEQGATHAAQGYARTSGKAGVVIATSGPGATNLITGIADAQIDSTPLVCITGQVPSNLLGTDAFQETDIIDISMPVTKWNYQVTKAEEIPLALAKAFYIAQSGRPGPVLVDITKDAQFQTLDFYYERCQRIRSYVPVTPVNDDKIAEAADLINKAKRPYIIAGQGVILGKAEQEFKKFIEITGIPTATTALGLSALPTDHPLNVGMVGMHGHYGPNLLTNECDVLIAVGMRFDDRVTGKLDEYAKQAKVIHLEIDPAEIDKNVKADVPVVGNAKEALEKLNKLVSMNTHKKWHNRFKECYEEEYKKVIKKELHPTQETLTMAEVIKEVASQTKGEAVMVSDVGQHQMFTWRYSNFKNTRSNITSGGLGTMGFCLPAAIGAKLGNPKKTVVAVIGDGGFQMTIQELGTIFQTKVNVKIIILNNEFLGMVRQWQELFFDKRYSSTEMVNPNFVAIAKGYDIEAKTVTQRNDLENSIKKMLEYEGSYLLEVMVGKEDNIFPMIASGTSVSDVRLE